MSEKLVDKVGGVNSSLPQNTIVKYFYHCPECDGSKETDTPLPPGREYCDICGNRYNTPIMSTKVQ